MKDRAVGLGRSSRRTERWEDRLTALLVALLVVILLFDQGMSGRIGDGSEYLLMMTGWAEELVPYSTDQVGEAYDDLISGLNHPGQSWVPYSRLKREHLANSFGGLDHPHFWFYSMMAAIFYWPLRFFELDPTLSFMLLHFALLGGAVLIVRRLFGPIGALTFVLLVLCSPAIFYINKVHTEFFTVTTTTVAMALFMKREYGASAAAFALASTQNPPFAFASVLCLAFALSRQGLRSLMNRPLTWVACLFLMALHPLYYLVGLGVITPTLLAGTTQMGNPLSLKLLTMNWIDPDLGLLPLWPLGLWIILVFVTLTLQQKKRFNGEPLLFGLLSTLPTAVSSFIYEYSPWLYDPVPEVFYERRAHTERKFGYGQWAVSTPSGSKILVSRARIRSIDPEAVPNVINAPQLDPVQVFEEARKRLAKEREAEYIYIDGRGRSWLNSATAVDDSEP